MQGISDTFMLALRALRADSTGSADSLESTSSEEQEGAADEAEQEGAAGEAGVVQTCMQVIADTIRSIDTPPVRDAIALANAAADALLEAEVAKAEAAAGKRATATAEPKGGKMSQGRGGKGKEK